MKIRKAQILEAMQEGHLLRRNRWSKNYYTESQTNVLDIRNCHSSDAEKIVNSDLVTLVHENKEVLRYALRAGGEK